MSNFAELVSVELAEARRMFPAQHSDHEAYAVLLEELDEAWSVVKECSRIQCHGRAAEKLLHELVQVAAMTQRWAEDLGYVQ